MANKKINQLVAKTTIQSTDLFPLGDATTGQLFKKTIAELQAAIGGAVISVNGLVGTVVLDTDDIQELASPTNRYFTDARARGAISLTVSGNSGASTYNSSTGVLNVPTYTLAGLGGITASFLSGASGIAYNSSTGVITYTGTVFTDASIRALVSAGAGLSYNSSTGVFSYSGTVYTDSSIRALISLTTSGSSGASTYNNTTGVLNVPTYTLAGLGGIGAGFLSGGAGITYNSSTGVIAYSGTVYTDSSVRGLFSATAPITYNSSTGAIGITQASTSANGFLSSTDWNTFNGKQNALTLGNVTEVASNVLMFPDGGTNKTIGNLTIQVVQAGSTTNGFLSTTDWNTFNNKQGTITLTTTGTSGAATLSSGTLNIPQYQAVLTNPVTGTGTTNFVTKWTSSSAIGNSIIFDNSTTVFINTTSGGFNTPRLLINNGGTTSIGFQVIADNGGRVLRFQTSDFNNTNTGSALRINFGAATGNTYSVINAYSAGESVVNNLIFNQSGGSIGIGTTAPLKILHLSTNGNDSGILWTYNPGGDYRNEITNVWDGGNAAGCKMTFKVSNGSTTVMTTAMTLTGAGDLGVGTTGPSTKLHVYEALTNASAYLTVQNNRARNAAVYTVTSNGGFYAGTSIGTDTFNYQIYDAVAGVARITITSGGNILMNTSSDNGERLYVSGSIRATGSITANSDVRLKKNIERIENALQKVSEISGYTYNTIYDEDRHAGVIAQEIDKVLPEIVNKGNDGLMGVEYGNISALLIEAIKDLKVQNDSLLARLSALEK